MKIHPAPQGSGEWLLARSTILTASNLSKVLTPAKLEFSTAQTCHDYASCIAAARVWGIYADTVSNSKMDRGSELEAEARYAYLMLSQTNGRECGLCITDDGLFGFSPDGIEEGVGGFEIKCPEGWDEDVKMAKHLRHLLCTELPTEYKMQVQGALWGSGYAWWDWCSYYPGLPVKILRVYPDPRVQEAISLAVPRFEALVLEYVSKFEALKSA